MKTTTTFILLAQGEELNLSILLTELKWARSTAWIKSSWTSGPALVNIKSGSSRPYIGQKFDEKYFKLQDCGWDHDHCDLCCTKIQTEYEDIYLAGQQIICGFCYS
ncbi:MAG: hypothetical protein WBA16_09735 [Nonlabens sp.]